MKKIIYVVFLVSVIGAVWAGFYYKDTLFKTYNDFGKNIEQFKKTDLANTINEIAKNVLTPPPLRVGGQQSNVVLVKSKIVAQTNIQRFDNGLLPPLSTNAKLEAAALAKAQDMFNKQYFEHVSPSGLDPGTLVKNAGYEYILSGENLILGNFKDEQELVQAWMDSPGHRANILNERFVDIGVAIIKGTYKEEVVWIGVQEFGLPLSACQSPNASLKAQIDSNISQLNSLSVQIEAKKEQINKTNRRSKEYENLVQEHNDLVAQYNELNQTTKSIITTYNAQVNTFNQCVVGD